MGFQDKVGNDAKLYLGPFLYLYIFESRRVDLILIAKSISKGNLQHCSSAQYRVRLAAPLLSSTYTPIRSDLVGFPEPFPPWPTSRYTLHQHEDHVLAWESW